MHRPHFAWALLCVTVAIGACSNSDSDRADEAEACSSENVVDDIDDGIGPGSAP